MRLLHAHGPQEYQRLFCERVGLGRAVVQPDGSELRSDPSVGSIRHFGSLDTIQSGLGDYSVSESFLISLDYDFAYLHFGVVYQGVTYTLRDGELVAGESPSAFVGIDRSPVGVYHWRAGQHFKGAEVSVEMGYLRRVLLPALGLAPDALAFLESGVSGGHAVGGEGLLTSGGVGARVDGRGGRSVGLPELLRVHLARFEEVMRSGSLTPALQVALTMEFIALLVRPDVREQLSRPAQGEGDLSGLDVARGPSATGGLGSAGAAGACVQRVRVGSRTIALSVRDELRIERAQRLVAERACDFPTTRALAQQVGLSEQKLKAGFLARYQQTVWDYANSVRMSEAVRLLRDTGRSVTEVSRAVGYQSQAAFTTMFRRWAGVTPHQFRIQVREGRGGSGSANG